MILLAIDTSTPRAALALDPGPSGPGPIVAPAPVDPAGRHGRGLIPAIRDLLLAAGLRPGDLGGVAVGLGPGSYTGLRIGLTAAKTIAYAGGIPLYPLDSLEAIARSGPHDAAQLAVVVDAQRGDGYVAEFARDRPGDPLRRLGPTRVEPLAPWALGLAPGTLVLGPGLDRLALPWPPSLARGTLDHGHPDPLALLGLAREAVLAGRSADPFPLEPVYLRRSAAEDLWESRTGKDL